MNKSQFLPRLSSMTAEQRVVFTHQVLDFQSSSLPYLESAARPWNKETQSVFNTGLRLISALPQAQSFCLVAHQYKDVRRRLDGFYTLFRVLLDNLVAKGNIAETTEHKGNTSSSTFVSTPPAHLVIGSKFSIPSSTGKAGRPEKPKNIPKVPAAGVALDNTILVNPDGSDPLQPTIAERPRHLDQYIRMLPENLQKEALGIRNLYMQMSDCSAKLQELCDNPKSTQKDRAYHACCLCNIEDKIKNLWARIDVAYAEATGKAVSDEYKKFLTVEQQQINGTLKEKTFAEMTKFDIDNINDPDIQAKAKEARINRDKKFLRKDDRKGDEQHRINLQDAAEELHAWGILITDTQADVCRKYGYDVPSDWIEPSPEERKKLRDQARNEQRRSERAKVRELRRAKKEAEQAAAAAQYQNGESIFKE